MAAFFFSVGLICFTAGCILVKEKLFDTKERMHSSSLTGIIPVDQKESRVSIMFPIAAGSDIQQQQKQTFF